MYRKLNMNKYIVTREALVKPLSQSVREAADPPKSAMRADYCTGRDGGLVVRRGCARASWILVAAVLGGLVVSGCSKAARKTPPPNTVTNATPAKATPEKTADVSVKAPKMATDTQAIDKVVSHEPAVVTHRVPVHPDPVTMKAANERRSAFAKKAIAEEIVRVETDLDKLSGQIDEIRRGVITTNETVKAAFKNQEMARLQYEQTRMALPGMSELYQKREAVKTRMKALRNPDDKRVEESAKALAMAKIEFRNLAKKMNELEITSRSSSPALADAVSGMRAAEAAYAASFTAIPEHVELENKHQKLFSEFEVLTKKQADLSKERN